VKYGCVLLSRVSQSGARQVIGFWLPGEIFGWEVYREHRYCAESAGESRVQAIEPSHAPASLYTQLVPSLALLRDQLLILSRPTAEARVAAFLHNLLVRQGGATRIDLPMHRFDIAEYLGISPETVSRVLHRLKKAGMIDMPNLHGVVVLNFEALKVSAKLETD